jgi:serine/threonine-protein kinase
MRLEADSSILHYRLIEKLGEGGMGVVWRAMDTTLDREVAIKFLPEAFTQDPDRLARFEREAKLLAGLNHPNIASVYSVHQVEGARFLAMELLPGEDLSQRLARGRMPVDEALRVAEQIAEGLEAAHDSGVIHRDLKPANVILTPEGKVKVLDFGLAKAFDAAAPSSQSDPSLSPTITSAGTLAGMIIGTAAYMSPEQARGQAADRRADIWSLGCVLLEMLSGEKVFSGGTVSDTLASVLKTEPDWDTLPRDTPSQARRLLQRCLRKDPSRRLRDAGDARILLQEAIDGGDEPVEVAATTSARRFPWAVAGLLALLALFLLLRPLGTGPDAAATAPRHLALQLPVGVELEVTNDRGNLAISPDGRQVVYTGMEDGDQNLYLQRLDGGPAVVLEARSRATHPFFSPDGEWIAYFAAGKLRKLSLRGGNPIDLIESSLNRGGVWTEDGTIVLSTATTGGLSRVPAAGGQPEPLTELDASTGERTHRWPSALPDGKTVLFTIGVSGKPGDYEDADIGAVSLETGERRIIYRGASMARYVPTGHLLLGNEGMLSAVPFDLDRLEVTGDPVPVMQNVAGEPSSGIVFFDVALDGTLVFAQRDPSATELELIWVDRQGNVEPLPAPFREYQAPRLAPDGKRVAVGVGPGSGRTSDLWLYDVPRDAMTRLTFDQSSSFPVWSPDGTHLTYGSRADGATIIVRKSADGSGAQQTLLDRGDAVPRNPAGVSPDGRHVVYHEMSSGASSGIFLLSSEEGVTTHLVHVPGGTAWGPAISPDGKWLAYCTDESGEPEVYVRSLEEGGGRWQISEGGNGPVWARDGTELFYSDSTQFYAVSVTTSPTFTHGKPRLLFDMEYSQRPGRAMFDVAPDGERFLMVRPTSEVDTTRHLKVVVDWFTALRNAGGTR